MVEYEKEKDAGDSEKPQLPSRFLSFSHCEQEKKMFQTKVVWFQGGHKVVSLNNRRIKRASDTAITWLLQALLEQALQNPDTQSGEMEREKRWKFSIRPSPVWVHNGIVSRVEETCCASFCEVWLKDIGPRSYARYSPIRSPEPPPNEFGRSWSQVSVAHSRKLSSEYRQQTQRRLYELVRRQTPTSYTFEPSK
ncbi:hypothetical protein EAG_11736 [Camponotus floridanus]|uniref:Uncharacterized protein n=1 Tax=Camponotus floridanus TaxID=104421 RepID=E2AYG5_CAMFO|nr:hypothetical protein EAG_11736 [Camponotus floridanus]